MQLAKYILWSLLLAVYHVGACALIWKLSILSVTSKPWLVLEVLCFKCMSRAFWLRLWKIISWSSGKVIYQHTLKRDIEATKGSVQMPDRKVLQAQANDVDFMHSDVIKNVGFKDEVKSDDSNAKDKELNSWLVISRRVDLFTTAAYLLGNILAFAFYMCPILNRIIVHYSVTDYIEI